MTAPHAAGQRAKLPAQAFSGREVPHTTQPADFPVALEESSASLAKCASKRAARCGPTCCQLNGREDLFEHREERPAEAGGKTSLPGPMLERASAPGALRGQDRAFEC
eukprot:9503944-Pyramimonas_sp.AAC.2